jgi:hypothetical protein
MPPKKQAAKKQVEALKQASGVMTRAEQRATAL